MKAESAGRSAASTAQSTAQAATTCLTLRPLRRQGPGRRLVRTGGASLVGTWHEMQRKRAPTTVDPTRPGLLRRSVRWLGGSSGASAPAPKAWQSRQPLLVSVIGKNSGTACGMRGGAIG